MSELTLEDRINALYFRAVRRFREEGWPEIDCHRAAMAAMNGKAYVPK